MEREFLKSLGLTDEVIDKIMAQHGKSIEAAKKAEADAQKQNLTAKDTEIEGLKGQIAQRDKDIKTLQAGTAGADEVKKQLEELQNKYKTDTEALTKKLKDQQTEYERNTATDKFFAGVKFSSSFAKEAAVSHFKEKAFKLNGDTFEGGKEWLEELRKTSPDAFASEEPPAQDPPKPNFGGSVKGQQGGNQPSQDPFNFGFNAVRKA